MNHKIVLVGLVLTSISALAEDKPFERTATKPVIWSRTPGAITSVERGNGVFDIRHMGQVHDWAVSGLGTIPVKPGEIYELTCGGGITANGETNGNCVIGAVLRGKGGVVFDWVFGAVKSKAGRNLKATLVIPPSATSIEPRITGGGAFIGSLGPLSIRRTGTIAMPKLRDVAPVTFSNEILAVTLEPMGGKLSITDRRTGRVWNSTEVSASPVPAPIIYGCTGVARKGKYAVEASYCDPTGSMPSFKTCYALEDNELVFTLIPDDVHGKFDRFSYPRPFATHPGERLVIANAEGMSYPVEEQQDIQLGYSFLGGWGCAMNFFGITEAKTGEALMTLVETPANAELHVLTTPKPACLTADVVWRPSMGEVGEPRQLRIICFTKGGHVAMAKRYREHARKMGWLKTFKEKMIRRPEVAKLPGALNFWYWKAKNEQDAFDMMNELESSGITHYLWSHGGSPALVKALRAKGRLVGQYNVCRDIYTPEVMEKAYHSKNLGTNGEAWPNDVVKDAEGNDVNAWGLELKDGTMIYTKAMCDVKAPFHFRKRLKRIIEARPYNAQFMDVIFAAHMQECWSPLHRMNEQECLVWRNELLRMMGDEFGLVIGTECGIDAAVPNFDYGEGIMSIGQFRLPRAGRDVGIPWTNAVPAKCTRYMIGEKYRVPLWELVFHDCAAAHWYWGDCNDRSVEMWAKRDLFNVLYGTAPMFVCSREYWNAHKAQYLKSYNLIEPVATATGFSEMTDHEILKDDWSVQRTRFANGVVVTVNFGDQPFSLPEGEKLAPGSSKVEGIK